METTKSSVLQNEFHARLKNILFLDIETVCCCPTYSELGQRLMGLWDKKAGFLDSAVPKEDLFFQRGAVYAEFGRIVAIGAGMFFVEDDTLRFKVKAFRNEDEALLLKEFAELLNSRGNLLLCAHNGKEFDFPYLCRRMLINGIKIPAVLDLSGKKPWEVQHLDTLEYWKFGDRKNFTSLELLAALFNVPTSKDEIDGSMVSEVFYKEKDLEKIARYCCNDVIVTAQLFLRFNQLDLVSKENIIVA